MNIIVVILILLLIFGGIGAGPWWGHSQNWGYAPVGGIGVVLIILVILLLMGRL